MTFQMENAEFPVIRKSFYLSIYPLVDWNIMNTVKICSVITIWNFDLYLFERFWILQIYSQYWTGYLEKWCHWIFSRLHFEQSYWIRLHTWSPNLSDITIKNNTAKLTMSREITFTIKFKKKPIDFFMKQK